MKVFWGLTIGFAISAASMVSGCSTVESKHEKMNAMSAVVEEGITTPSSKGPIPEEVNSALLPQMTIGIDGNSEAIEPRFDVRVRNARARDFFLSLVEGTQNNIVVEQSVSGRISLELKNVTVSEVIEVVRDIYGYDYEKVGTTYRIYPNEVRTEIIKVDYLNLTRSGNSSMSSSSGGIGSSSESGSDGETSNSGGSKVSTTSESQFWDGLKEDIELIVGSGEGRRVNVNANAGLVMVRARPDELRDVRRFLQEITKAVQRQVILEARIVEVVLSDNNRTGIDWSAFVNDAGESAVFGPSGAITFAASGISTGAVTSSASTSSTLGVFTNDFSAVIDLLQSQGSVQVLSSPRVSTVNNQKAVIKVGSDEYFVTDVDSNTTTGTATTQNVSVELEPFFSGVALDVTPQISESGDVILHIHPAISQVQEQTKSINTNTGSLTLPLAASTIRESDSVIRAKNGQIVVIGGLMQDRTTQSNSKVPLLGDIPVLGRLFSHTEDVVEKTELVILLKPTVVERDEAWSDALRRSNESLKKLDRYGGQSRNDWQ